MAYNRRYAARKIQRVFRKFAARRAMGMAARKGRFVRRAVGLGNPSPTFVETFKEAAQLIVPANPIGIPSGVGKVFGARITDIPQLAQYANLYKQYRINWIKAIVIPDYNYQSADINSAVYNQAAAGLQTLGMLRVAYAIQDSPNVAVPVAEATVLQDNGCKVKSVGTKWVCSFKPVPDVQQQTGVGAIWSRQKFRQWFNFDLGLPGNNPFHGAVQSFWTPPASPVATGYALNVYYKISFTLRDPQ